MSTFLEDEQGRKFVFEGLYRPYIQGDFYLSEISGLVKEVDWTPSWSTSTPPQYAILRRIFKKHTFGDVVFEETGESRIPREDEYALDGCRLIHILFGDEAPSHDCTILKPVEIDGKS